MSVKVYTVDHLRFAR